MRKNLPKLSNYMISTLQTLGLPCDFTLELRGYSKTYNGLYYPTTRKIVLYVLDENQNLYPLERLMSTLIHEAVHHYQFVHDPNYERVKGVMHNHAFRYLFNRYFGEYQEMEETAHDQEFQGFREYA